MKLKMWRMHGIVDGGAAIISRHGLNFGNVFISSYYFANIIIVFTVLHDIWLLRELRDRFGLFCDIPLMMVVRNVWTR